MEFDKKLYGTCCNYAYYCLSKLNIKEYKAQDVVNEFYFESDVTLENYKKHVYAAIKELNIKPLNRLNCDFIIKQKIYQNCEEAQCLRCKKTMPIAMFYVYGFTASKKCKECICYEQKRDYSIKTASRLLRKKQKDIAEIDNLIIQLQLKKQEIQNG